MMENKISNNREERIMRSLDGISRAGVPDFFYTRLTGKMQREQEDKPFFLLRPAFITAVLSVFLLINIFSLVEIKGKTKQDSSVSSNKPATIETFAKAYNMNAESVYE